MPDAGQYFNLGGTGFQVFSKPLDSIRTFFCSFWAITWIFHRFLTINCPRFFCPEGFFSVVIVKNDFFYIAMVENGCPIFWQVI